MKKLRDIIVAGIYGFYCIFKFLMASYYKWFIFERNYRKTSMAIMNKEINEIYSEVKEVREVFIKEVREACKRSYAL